MISLLSRNRRVQSELEAVGWGIKIANCEFFTDRRSLSRTKTGIQTPY